MPKAKVNGINIYYEIEGQDKKETIVFIAGFCSDHNVWTEIKTHFAKTHQVIVLDNRGAGQSDCPDIPYTVDMMAEDVVNLCQVLGLESCHFVGSSIGSTVVQTLAFKYPTLVRTATLSNTFTQIDTRFALFAQGMLELYKVSISVVSLTKLSLGWAFSSNFLNQTGKIEKILELAAVNPYPMTEIGYRNQLHALLTFNSNAWIHHVHIPCLVIGSDQDQIVPEAHVKHIAHQIPNADYHCFSGSGHVPYVEQPEAYKNVLSKFLESKA